MRILMSMFGWQDSGGGTIMPRQTALDLQARGHEVMVIYAAAPQLANAAPYTVREDSEDGVQLVGIYNRPALFLDAHNPAREVYDPQIKAIFADYFAKFKPDVVHYHNFLGLSLAIADLAHETGTPNFYTPYNFWLLCPTLYLNLPDLALCRGVNASGSNCLSCTRAPLPGSDFVQRRDQLRTHYSERIGACLATSVCVRELLLENGYSSDKVELFKLANGRAAKLWQEVGLRRQPGVTGPVKIGFTGQVVPIKGVHKLVAAAQHLQGDFRITIHGEGPEAYMQHLRQLDTRQIVSFPGYFADADHGRILAEMDLAVVPSVCFDHSPLVISEFMAARIPVIGAEIGGIPDYIPAGTGQLYAAESPEALAQVLQNLIDKPQQIADMQARISEPPAFAEYVSALEARYQAALLSCSPEQLERRVHQALQHPQRFYQAQTLLALSAPTPPYGLSLHCAEELAELGAETLQAATWIRVSDPDLLAPLQALAPAVPAALVLPLQAELTKAATPQALEIPSSQPHKLLLPLCAQDSQWQEALQAYLNQAGPDMLCVLVPWQQSLDAAQDQLLDWLDTTGLDPEAGPELLLLEAENLEQLAQVLQQVEGLLAPTVFLNQLDLQPYLPQAPWILSTNELGLPARLAAQFKPLELTGPLASLAAALPGWQSWQARHSAAEHQAQMAAAWLALLQHSR